MNMQQHSLELELDDRDRKLNEMEDKLTKIQEDNYSLAQNNEDLKHSLSKAENHGQQLRSELDFLTELMEHMKQQANDLASREQENTLAESKQQEMVEQLQESLNYRNEEINQHLEVIDKMEAGLAEEKQKRRELENDNNNLNALLGEMEERLNRELIKVRTARESERTQNEK